MLSVLEMISQKHTQVMDFDEKNPYMLEVAQVFDDELMDVQLFHVDEEITIGSDVGRRLRFAGQPIAWIPQSFSALSVLMYPFLQTQDEWKSHFFSPIQQNLISWNHNKATIHIPKGWSCWYQTQEGKREPISSRDNIVIIEAGKHIIIEGDKEWFSLRYVHPAKPVPVPWTSYFDGGTIGIAAAVMLSVLTFWYGVQQHKPIVPQDNLDVALQMFEATARIIDAPMPEEVITVSKKLHIDKNNSKKKNTSKSNGSIHKKMGGSGGSISKSQVVHDFISGLDFGSSSDSSSDIIGSTYTIGTLSKSGGSPFGGGGIGESGIGGGGNGSEPDGFGFVGNGGVHTRVSTAIKTPPRTRNKLVKTTSKYTVLGGLDRSFIDTVIKRNISQIRYCYQRELSKSPSLAGKVKVKFVISKNGSVSRASIATTTLNSQKVEDCILNRFMKFTFPKPEGGIVVVKYPFVFQSIQ